MKTKAILLGITVIFFNMSANVYGDYIEANLSARNSMFADVDLEHENYNAIYYLKNTGVIQGYEVADTTIPDYRPNANVNRAEFLKIIMEGNEIEVAANYESCFPDVPGHEWFTGYVCKAKEEGWINGYPDGTFKPEQTINEVESVKILAEVLDWEKPQLDESAEWYDYYLQPAEEKKIVPNEDINSQMTRGDIAELVYRNSLVSELDVPYYDQKWEPNLFEQEEIPLTGQLGPGGIFGPGGPLGPSGAFVDGGIFDPERGKAELIPDSFFENNFCYFSDEGEFSGDNLAFLQDYTQEDLDKYVTDAIVDEFGQMFCYTGIAETHLQLFDESMREEFDILCWREPDFATKEEDGWDEILCWARQKDVLETLPVDEKLGLSIEVLDFPDFAVNPASSQVELLRFNVSSSSDEEEGGISGLDLQSYGQNDPYVIDRILVKDDNENIYFDGKIYMTDWHKNILTLDFDAPLIANPGEEILLSVYADLSWEDHNGDLQIGFAGAMLSSKVLTFIGKSLLGSIIGLEEEVSENEFEEQVCNLSEEGKTDVTAGREPPDVVEVNDGMHLVVPITQKGDTCVAAASYSSLRWLEEKLGIDYLVVNGQAGYDKLIKLLHDDTYTLEGQYKAFKKYINETFKGCLKADYQTVGWSGENLKCEDLKNYYDKGCDIPLGLRCKNPGDWVSWGHRVDIVDVQIDAENPHKCQIIFANSQTGNAGETNGPDDPDGLGYGSYQRGDYYDDENKFDIKAPWGKGKSCWLYGATYVCVEDEEFCKNNPNIIQLPE